MKILSNISLKNFLKCGFSLFVFIPLSALPQSSDFVLFPASLIVSCDNIPPVAVIGTEVTSNNSCPPDNITYLGQITSDSSCPGNYKIIRTWRLNDGCSNVKDSSQVITVIDTTPPSFSLPPNITVYRNNACSIDTSVAATGNVSGLSDNCSSSFSISYSDNTSGLTGCNNTGIIIRTWNVRDLCNNLSSKQQIISVADTSRPSMACKNITRLLDAATGTVSVMPAEIDAGTTDNCSFFSLSISQSVFNCTHLGDNPVTLTATDACGNTAVCNATITIDYALPPVSSSTVTSDTLCNGDTVLFTLTGTNPLTHYTWTVNRSDASLTGVSGGSGNVGVEIKQIPYNHSDSVNTVTYFIQPSTYGCNDSAFRVVYKINPTPSLSVSLPDTFICNHGTAAITVSSMNGPVVGEKYYHVTKTYNVSALTGIAPEGDFPTGSYTETIHNQTALPQTLLCHYEPLIRNPKGNQPSFYCRGGISKQVVLHVLPDLKTTLTNQKYTGGWDVNCYDSATGKLQLTVSGGYIGFHGYTQDSCSFAWSHGSTVRNPQQVGLGTYHVLVTDKKGCQARDTIVLSQQPPPLYASFTLLNALSCMGKSDGSLRVNTGGGTPGYRITWTGPSDFIPQQGSVAVNLHEGQYRATITDTNNCRYARDTILIAPYFTSYDLIPLEYGAYHVSCHGNNDGKIETNSILGGIPPYRILWMNEKGDTLQYASNIPQGSSLSISNLPTGKYSLKVIDQQNCYAYKEITLKEPDPLQYQANLSLFYNGAFNIRCGGGNDGSITIQHVTGGHGHYSLEWNDGKQFITPSNPYALNELKAGKYYLTIKDSVQYNVSSYAYCYFHDSIVLTEPDSFKARIKITSDYHGRAISCYGEKDARLEITFINGRAPYFCHWNTGHTTTLLQGTGAGVYMVEATDSAGCYATDTLTVPQPDSLTVKLQTKKPTCYNTSDGSITAEVTGGTSPYFYEWSSGAKSPSVVHIKEGTYTVTVKDVNNCSIKATGSVVPPAQIKISVLTSFPLCPETTDGSATLTIQGGQPPYHVEWFESAKGGTPVGSGPVIENLASGPLYAIIKDSAGCQVLQEVAILAQNEYCLDIPSVFTPNADGKNDTWNIMAGKTDQLQNLSVVYPQAVVEVFDRWGTLVFKSEKGYPVEWNGRFMNTGRELPADSYYYVITLDNMKKPVAGLITILR